MNACHIPPRTRLIGTLSRLIASISASITLSILLTACASTALEDSKQLIAEGRPDAAMTLLADAMKQDPSNKAMRAAYFRLRDQVLNQVLAAADRARIQGNLAEVSKQANLAQQIDRDNARVQALQSAIVEDSRRATRLREAETLFAAKKLTESESIARALLAESPGHATARSLLRKIDEAQSSVEEAPALKSAFIKPITLEFRDTPLRSVFEAISRTAGINFIFDKDVKADAKVTVFVRNTQIDEVIRMVLSTNALERKMLNENSMLIYPAIAAKQREYLELSTRTFYLTNTDVKQAQVLIKTVVKTRDIFVDEKLNMLVMKDTPDAIRMAEKLIAQLDVADAEVMLEVEVLEVLRSRLTNLGLQFPETLGLGLLQPTINSSVTTAAGITQSTTLGGTLSQGNINLRNTGALVPYAPNPGMLLNLKDHDGSSNILANPRIRVRNREKAKIHIGDKLPVFTTTSTANVGVSASVTYLDVGLKLDVEPTIRLDDDVEIKVGLEVSSVTKEVAGPSNSLAYQIGTRNTTTVLRLRDGETQVLAGLISDEERSSGTHLPGIGRIPILGHLFSNAHDSNSKTEIILLITPHVLRNITPSYQSRASMAAGTDANVGAPPMRVTSPTPPRSLDVRGTSASAPTTRTPAPPSSPTPNDGENTSLTLTGPARLSAGQEFVVTVAASSDAPIRSGEVLVTWDGALFELPNGTAASNATLSLKPSGASATAQLQLRAKANANGDGMIEITSSRISAAADDIAVNNPQGLAIKVIKP